jgi:hypothetical protein
MTNNSREENPLRPADADYPSPISPEHQLDWPGLGSQHQQMQTYGNRANIPNANSSLYQNNNQQLLFKKPRFRYIPNDTPRNDSYNLALPIEDKGFESKLLKCSTN